jgi:uncharacterized protein YcfJ
MTTFPRLAIAASALALAVPMAPAAAAELPRPATNPLVLSAVSMPANEIAAQRKSKRARIYDDRGRYVEPRRLGRNDRVWRGDDGRWRCRRDNGTTGLIIGAGAGALLGRTIDTEGDRTLGTVLGAVGGGLIGREIDRGEIRCR